MLFIAMHFFVMCGALYCRYMLLIAMHCSYYNMHCSYYNVHCSYYNVDCSYYNVHCTVGT